MIVQIQISLWLDLMSIIDLPSCETQIYLKYFSRFDIVGFSYLTISFPIFVKKKTISFPISQKQTISFPSFYLFWESISELKIKISLLSGPQCCVTIHMHFVFLDNEQSKIINKTKYYFIVLSRQNARCGQYVCIRCG